MERFEARANAVLLVLGFFVVIFLLKAAVGFNFDPLVYDLKISGNDFLNSKYLDTRIMPIGGVRLSKLSVPSDPFIKSYAFEYMGSGTAELRLVERKPELIVSTGGGYFLSAKDGVFLMKLSKDELYKATGLPIFFGIDPVSVGKEGIINPNIKEYISKVMGYESWFRKEILEVNVGTKTLYLPKGISVKLGSFEIDSAKQRLITMLVSKSPIGSRYLDVGQTLVRLQGR